MSELESDFGPRFGFIYRGFEIFVSEISAFAYTYNGCECNLVLTASKNAFEIQHLAELSLLVWDIHRARC